MLNIKLSSVLQRAFLAKLAFVSEFAETQDTRYYSNGVFCKVEKEKGLVTFVATEGHVLAKAEYLFDCDNKEGLEDCEFIIPTKAVKDFIKNISKDNGGEITFDTSTNEILLKVGCSTIYTKAIEGKYPDYARVIPQSDRAVSLQAGDFVGLNIELIEKVIKGWKSYKKFSKCRGYFKMNVANTTSCVMFTANFDENIKVIVMPMVRM